VNRKNNFVGSNDLTSEFWKIVMKSKSIILDFRPDGDVDVDANDG